MKSLQFTNGNTMPAIGLGTWKAKGEKVKNAVIAAIKMGYRHIDTAAIYGNEEAIGEALQQLFRGNIITRKELFITSKLWNDAHHPDDVGPALKDSLQKLQLDYLDLYLMHWPVAFKKGVPMPSDASDYVSLTEIPLWITWEKMVETKKEGLAKHIGVSNFSQKKLKDLLEHSKEVPEVNQIELHPLLQQKELIKFCKQHEILVTAYSPLGSGDRSDAMKAPNEPNLFDLDEIKKIAQKHGVHPAQVLIHWHLQRGTSVIPKSVTPKNMQSNLEASSLLLDEEDVKMIDGLDRHYRFVTGNFFLRPEKGYHTIYDE